MEPRLPNNSWWHWPALIGFGVILGLWAAAIGFAPSPKNMDLPHPGLADAEVERELKFCHDKGMTTAHSPGGNAPIEKVWCLMEIPK
jgi:hypothetical protein